MKRILIFIVFNLLIFSCKENSKVEENNITSKVSNSHTNVSVENKAEIKESLNQEGGLNCNQVLLNFVKSSTLNNPFKESLSTEIEDKDDDEMRIILYDESNVVGSLRFDAKSNKLFDLTNDIENPEELKFDINEWNTIIDCFFDKNKKYYLVITNVKNNVDCKTRELGMDFEESCLIRNTTIKEVYLDLIKNKLVDNSHKLKINIPQKNEKAKVNNDGLINVDYVVVRDMIKIEMIFEGGVTTILLEQIDKDVKRVIIRSAD
jgi:hypothetical protein